MVLGCGALGSAASAAVASPAAVADASTTPLSSLVGAPAVVAAASERTATASGRALPSFLIACASAAAAVASASSAIIVNPRTIIPKAPVLIFCALRKLKPPHPSRALDYHNAALPPSPYIPVVRDAQLANACTPSRARCKEGAEWLYLFF